MPEKPLVRFTLNGRSMEAPEGTLIIDAAKEAGIEVPHFCYHPGLGNPGVCRLCMCEVEGSPKPLVSCRARVKAGMAVRLDSERARQAQRSSLELHLANHPLDCPVCDQAGECRLQDYYMRYGLYASAAREDKVHKAKREPIGPNILLDQERCILCTRCTRFLDQVTHTNELGVFNRGDRDVVAPVHGRRVENPYAGNLVDVCPVGALTDKDFRFKVRVWYLTRTPSICTRCARGCSIDIHANLRRPWHTPDARVARLKPRHNPQVNGWWMCDEGRYGYKDIDSPLRLKYASRRSDGALERVSAGEAARGLARHLSGLLRTKGPEGLAVVVSGTLSNEDLFAARRLFVETLKAGRILVGPGPDQLGVEDELLRRKERVPNHAGAAALGFGGKIPEASWDELKNALASGKVWGLYVVDRDPVGIWGSEAAGLLARVPLTVYQGSHSNRFTQVASWVLPSCSYAEEDATFTNFEGQVQRAHAAIPALSEASPDWLIFERMLAEIGDPPSWRDASDVFAELASAEPVFSGMTFDSLGSFGRKLGHGKDPRPVEDGVR